ncbi:MAG: hypothetical protein WCA45_07025 [Thiobacillaceae bacterium]
MHTETIPVRITRTGQILDVVVFEKCASHITDESFLARNSHHPDDKLLGEHTMMKFRNTLPHVAHGDIERSELLDILDRVVEAKCGLSEIYQLLDNATTMSEIRARFARWQAGQRVRTRKDPS